MATVISANTGEPASASNDISVLFTHHQIVPDVVPSPPKTALSVVYGDGVQVNGGNEMLISGVQSQPTINYPTEAQSFYTLYMIDPDNDSRETHKYRQFIHWLVINIPGVVGGQQISLSNGLVVSPYMGSAPGAGTGRHRYVFLLMKQSAPVDPANVKKFGEPGLLGLKSNMMERANHDINAWWQQHGQPVPELLAGNFYFAEEAK